MPPGIVIRPLQIEGPEGAQDGVVFLRGELAAFRIVPGARRRWSSSAPDGTIRARPSS